MTNRDSRLFMGSALGSLTEPEATALSDLRGDTVVIDGHLCLYQFLTAITDEYNDYIRNDDGEPISHLIGLLGRMGETLDKGIYPIFVFDGGYPELKEETLESRHAGQQQAREEFWEAKAAGDKERAQQLAYQKVGVTDEIIESATDLLDAFGIPVIRAPGEGEPQCAQLVHDGVADHVATEDWDTLLYETPSMLTSYGASGANTVRLQQVLDDHEWTFQQLLWYGILRGTDYNSSPSGVGSVYGKKIVNNADCFEAVVNAALTYDESIDPDRWFEVRDVFTDPEVESGIDPEWPGYDPDAVYSTLVGRYGLADWQVQNKLDSIEVDHL